MFKTFVQGLKQAVKAGEMFEVPRLVNGELKTSATNDFHEVFKKSTGEAFAIVPENTMEEYDEAMEVLKEGFLNNKNMSTESRCLKMFDVCELMKEYKEDCVEIVMTETGKTRGEASAGFFRAQEHNWFAAGAAGHLTGKSLQNLTSYMDSVSYREPLGVCYAILPANFPKMCGDWFLPNAMVTGNAMLMKPSRTDPLSAVATACLYLDAGWDPALISVLHGGREAVNYGCTHPDIHAVGFVGGNVAGQHVASLACANLKKVQCNMGASNIVIVLPDADKEFTVTSVCNAADGDRGERCMSGSRVILVGESSEWLDDIVEVTSTYKVGSNWEDDTDVGPLLTAQSVERIHGLLEGAEKEGAEILLDGRNVEVEGNGYYLGPTVLTVDTSMEIYHTEVFGPVLQVLTMDTMEEALDTINASPYGNGTCVFTSNGASARKFVHEVECGQVGINVPIPVPIPPFSFTGSKASFTGDRNVYGIEGLEFFTKNKTVTSLWNENLIPQKGTSFPLFSDSEKKD